jgi:hypothetical protein
MNRRRFFQTAAAASAFGLQTNASPREIGTRPNGGRKPFETEIADPKAPWYFRDACVDVFARLEELDPGDPGQLSGCSLRILDFDRLTAETDAIQRDGTRFSHCIGFVDAEEFAPMCLADRTVSLEIALRELGSRAYSGVWLTLTPGDEPTLTAHTPHHTFGILRGRHLKLFLGCLRTRFQMAELRG